MRRGLGWPWSRQVFHHFVAPWAFALVVIVCGLNASCALASEARQDPACFLDHLREAKAINRERMPQYIDATDGASRLISWILISSEAMAIPFATWLEWENKPLAQAGVGILCEDFVSMEHTPPFRRVSSDVPLPLGQFSPDRGWDDWGDFWKLSRAGAYADLARTADVVLAELALVPTYHCMYRHILESIRLAATRADDQLARARAKSLEREAGRVIDALVMSQVGVIPIAIVLDKLAAPLHARGIPIICQDVPVIGLPEK